MFNNIDSISSNYNTGLCPVINLNPDVTVYSSGNGTKDNPYVVE